MLRSQHREIAADVAVGGGQTLALSLRGRWTRERRAAVIESFSLASGGARWAQAGDRCALGYGAGRVTVAGSICAPARSGCAPTSMRASRS